MINLAELREKLPEGVGQAADKKAQRTMSAREVIIPATLVGATALTVACAPGEKAAGPTVAAVAKPEAPTAVVPVAKEVAAATPTALVTKEGRSVAIALSDFARFIGIQELTSDKIKVPVIADTLAMARGVQAQGLKVSEGSSVVQVSAGSAEYYFVAGLRSDGTTTILGFEGSDYVGYFFLGVDDSVQIEKPIAAKPANTATPEVAATANAVLPPIVELTATAAAIPTEAEQPTATTKATVVPEATKQVTPTVAVTPTTQETVAAEKGLGLDVGQSLVADLIAGDNTSSGAIMIYNAEGTDPSTDVFVYVHLRLSKDASQKLGYYVSFKQQGDGTFMSTPGKYDTGKYTLVLRREGSGTVTGTISNRSGRKYSLNFSSDSSVVSAFEKTRIKGEMLPAGTQIADSETLKSLANYGIVPQK